MEVIEGVEDVAHAAGLSRRADGERRAATPPRPDWIEGVLRRRPVGVVLVFSDISRAAYREKLRSRGIPFVIVDPAGDPSPDVPSVGSANWSGGLMATRHLIELGHRRIAAITGPEDMMCSLARVDGYRSAMNAAGLPIDPALDPLRRLPPRGRRDRTRASCSPCPSRPTAIFAGSDLQALGVIAAAREAGLRVPEDLSVVGYDDIALAALDEPAAHDGAPAAAAHGRGGDAPRAAHGRRRQPETPADGPRDAPRRAREHGAARRLTRRRRHSAPGTRSGRVPGRFDGSALDGSATAGVESTPTSACSARV